MPTPFRKESGHRIYESEQIKQLHFIKRARQLGFALSDIRELIGANNETPSCDEVFLLTQTHLSNIREKIVDLRKLENRLASIAKDCESNSDANCPIIDVLSM
jgi:MerR family mercuric resistance operon transcriptional regulator